MREPTGLTAHGARRGTRGAPAPRRRSANRPDDRRTRGASGASRPVERARTDGGTHPPEHDIPTGEGATG